MPLPKRKNQNPENKKKISCPVKNTRPQLDATNLTGITTLMNKQFLKKDIDLNSAETQIIKGKSDGKTGEYENIKDKLVKDFDNCIKLITDDLNINKSHKISSGEEKKKVRFIDRDDSEDESEDDDTDSESEESDSEDDITDSEEPSGESSEDESEGSDDSESEDESESESEESDEESEDEPDDDRFSSIMGKYEKKHNKTHSNIHFPKKRHSRHRTEEEEKREQITNVLSMLRQDTTSTFSMENERISDYKANKLEQIAQLRLILEEEGINCKQIPELTIDSSEEEIDSVYNILRLKNDRNRCSSLAEEIIIGGSEFLETIFDGTRKIPIINKYPDYTDVHNTIAVKLHRNRFETSQLVGSILEKYNIGNGSRLALELLPTFILYPWQRSRRKNSPGLYNDPGLYRDTSTTSTGMRQKTRESILNINLADNPGDLTT